MGLDDAGIDGLAEVNVKRVGELLTLPRAAVAARFGAPVLHALDRAMGRAPETIDPLRPTETLRVEQAFDGPCGCVETIGVACRELLRMLAATLDNRMTGLTEWATVLQRSDVGPVAIVVRHAAPSRDAGHLWNLLSPRLERADLGFGVEAVSITALRVQPMGERQQAWWSNTDVTEAPRYREIDALIDTLANRLGQDAVHRVSLHECHVPERAWVQHGVLDAPPPATAIVNPGGDRPTHLFQHAAAARVVSLSPDGPVSRVDWAGGTHDVAHCIGPERLRGEWWENERVLRDYFKVQDRHGLWLWVYRDLRAPGWYVHGMWG